MKKLAIVPLLCLLTVSCDGNGDGNGGPAAPSQTLSGTFAIESISTSVEGATATLTPPAATGTVVVNPDGTYTATINAPALELNNESTSGTWSLDGNQLTINDADGTTTNGTVSTDRNTITLSEVEDGATITIVLVRTS